MGKITDTPVETKGFLDVVRDAFRELKQTFVAFVKAPKALWGINIPYVLEGLVYFGILTILGKYCSENVQLSDVHAGWVYSGVTAGITLAMLFLGGVSDRIGVRKALTLAFLMFVVGRVLIAFSGSVPLGHGAGSPMFWTMVLGLFIMVVAYGLYQPAAYAGIKRYTNPQTAAMGYAVIYGLMNLGAFFSGLLSPRLREAFDHTFPPNGLTAVFWVYAGLSLMALVVTITILTRKTDEAAVAQIRQETDDINEANGKDRASETGGNTESKAIEPEAPSLLFSVLLLLTIITAALGVLIQTGKVAWQSGSIFGIPRAAACAYGTDRKSVV